MKVVIDLPDYDGRSLDVIWENAARYKIDINKSHVSISANRFGLISLAKQMLYMAYNPLPAGSHIHYDSFFTKMPNSKYELIIETQIDETNET